MFTVDRCLFETAVDISGVEVGDGCLFLDSNCGLDCVGVRLDSFRDVAKFMFALGVLAVDSGVSGSLWLSSLRMVGVDTCGVDVVIYFPGFVFADSLVSERK